MNPSSFDAIAKLFATSRLSRRQALAGGGAGLAAGALAAAGVAPTARAQEATPGPAAGAGEKVAFLFVQSFQSGSVEPKGDGAEGRYTLTLEQGLGQTIYFSDRPERIVGAAPTARFLGGIGFRPDNPPNAALVVETAPNQTDLAVVELFAPSYDEPTRTLTYEIAVLANWDDSLELGFTAAPTDLAALAPTFGAAHLFIDDCPDGTVACVRDNSRIGSIHDFGGYCYSWSAANCYTCSPNKDNFGDDVAYWTDQCNQRFPDCNGACHARNVCGGGFACPAGDLFSD